MAAPEIGHIDAVLAAQTHEVGHIDAVLAAQTHKVIFNFRS